MKRLSHLRTIIKEPVLIRFLQKCAKSSVKRNQRRFNLSTRQCLNTRLNRRRRRYNVLDDAAFTAGIINHLQTCAMVGEKDFPKRIVTLVRKKALLYVPVCIAT